MHLTRLYLFASLLSVVLVAACSELKSRAPKDSEAPTILPRDGFYTGVTHTQYSADSFGEAEAISRAKDILRTVGPLQNQHLMGWGALNPEPRPGVYDWASLDDRVQLMRETDGVMVLTLCCAPDWMKGGNAGETDWEKLEVAPLPKHFGSYAKLAVAAAKRYPDISYFQVWNEFKGFRNAAENRWDYEGYTRLYNEVYDALKAYNPDLQIGGPYVPMDSWRAPSAGGFPSDVRGRWGVVDQRALDAISFWLAHKHGADFLAIDGGTQTKDGFAPPPEVGVQKFSAINRWLRERTTLPIWWSEFYVVLKPGTAAASTPSAVRATLTTMRDSGANAALLWGPECDDDYNFPCLWTPTKNVEGGKPTPYVPVMREFSKH